MPKASLPPAKFYSKPIVLVVLACAGLSFFAWRFVHRAWLLNTDSECLVLKAGRIFDGLNSEYQTNKNIFIKNHKIIRIDDGLPKADQNCSFIDRSKAVVMPGLIDAHTHLLLNPDPQTNGPQSAFRFTAGQSVEERYAQGLMNARTQLLAGFTLSRDLGNSGYYLDRLLADAAARDVREGPRIVYSGPGFARWPTQLGGQLLKLAPFDYILLPPYQELDKFLQTELAQHFKYGAKWIKIYIDNDSESGGLGVPGVKKIVELAHAADLRVAAHVTQAWSARIALQGKVDSIEHFWQIPDVEFKAEDVAGTVVVLTDETEEDCLQTVSTDSAAEKKARCQAEQGRNRMRTQWALQHHMRIAFGSDYYGNGRSRGSGAKQALVALQNEGLSPFQVLQAAGVNAGQLLMRPDSGVLREGGPADLIAVQGDPLRNLESLNQMDLVVKEGRPICLDLWDCVNK